MAAPNDIIKRLRVIEKRNAPSIGFLLSTLALPLFKKLWLKDIYKK